ncbi:helix-turn-helix domain-containing protein [Thaumasiovibrio subtropicus]|uniref:helix-turn-helix domain-containing protein n=1 Tax=Thaumasiovibrio subtropicus TaxID=1891207 RepID=UPI000B356D87|nr:helix-turn-helix domain-containing protein [Thaumasiovibrio subtropicus]
MNKTVHSKAPIAQIAKAINEERKRAGLSLSEVAKQAGIAKSTLSQLENGNGNPNIETLWAICHVLDIPFSRLIEPAEPRVTLIRNGEGVSVLSEHSDYEATLLSVCPGYAKRDLYTLAVNPGSVKYSDPHNAGVIEHVLIAQGKARVGLINEAHILNHGDYISYPGDQPHLFEALEENTLAILISEYR